MSGRPHCFPVLILVPKLQALRKTQTPKYAKSALRFFCQYETVICIAVQQSYEAAAATRAYSLCAEGRLRSGVKLSGNLGEP